MGDFHQSQSGPSSWSLEQRLAGVVEELPVVNVEGEVSLLRQELEGG